MKSVFFAISLAYNKKKQYLRPTLRHNEFYVLEVSDSSHSCAALTRHTDHRQLFGAAQYVFS